MDTITFKLQFRIYNFICQPKVDLYYKKVIQETIGSAFIPPVLEAEMQKITDADHTISKSHNFIQELRHTKTLKNYLLLSEKTKSLL